MSQAKHESLSTSTVAYVRKSRDHPQNSTRNQMDAIRADAKWRGLEIVKAYSDAGQSGNSDNE